MNAASSPEIPAAESAEQRLARQMEMLRELAEIGMDMARALRDRVVAGAPLRRGEGDPAAAYARLARAVRLSMALEARLAEGPLFGEPAAVAAPVGSEDVSPPDVAASRNLVRGAVEDAIETEARERDDGVERERLLESLTEWLDEGGDALFVGERLDKLAERICVDLGIAWDPRYWTNAQAWALARETAMREAGAGSRAWPSGAVNSCDSS